MTIGKCENLTNLDAASNKLTYLPYTIRVLYNIKSVWLSENQTQAIPKFSEKRDERTGIKVVTCYLLPQYDALDPSHYDHDRGQVNRSFVGGPKVHFHDQQEDSTFDESPEVQLGNFERHNTPHPKTPKHKKGSIDGHMVPHEADQPRQLALAPSHHRVSTSSFGTAMGGAESSTSINRDLNDIRFIDAASWVSCVFWFLLCSSV